MSLLQNTRSFANSETIDRPDGAQPVKVKRYVLLLLDSYSVFEVVTVIECLKLANGFDADHRYEWTVQTATGTPPPSSSGISIAVDSGLTELNRDDTLIVFGGDAFNASGTLQVLNWLRRQARFGVKIGAVNSAAYTLAKAGLVKGEEVTTHWKYRSSLQETFDELCVTNAIFKLDRDRFTCAGGVAVLDLMLHLIAQEQGLPAANWVADNLVFSTPRLANHEQTFAHSARLVDRNTKVMAAIKMMQDALEDPYSPPEIADKLGISTRQLERLFTKAVDATPKAYYLKLRLDRARALLLQTNLKVIDVAFACGFNSTSHFSKKYKAQFGVSPLSENGIRTDA